MIEFGHGTHVGLRRKHNEDTYYADPALGLYLVADGMGGHRHGALASSLARDVIVADVTAGSGLGDAIRHADERIIAEQSESSDGLPMGTTVAVLHLAADDFEVAWVGDSRVYLWQAEPGLRRVSHDHSMVQVLIEQGVISEDQAREHPQRNIVTQALGVTAPEHLHVECARGRLEPGMRFVLCSDGLVDEIREQVIADIVARSDLAAQECVDHLILAALDAGGRDNISVVLVRIS